MDQNKNSKGYSEISFGFHKLLININIECMNFSDHQICHLNVVIDSELNRGRELRGIIPASLNEAPKTLVVWKRVFSSAFIAGICDSLNGRKFKLSFCVILSLSPDNE